MSWILNQYLLELIFLILILQILLKQRKIKEKVQVYQVCKPNFYPNAIIFQFQTKNNKSYIHVYICFFKMMSINGAYIFKPIWVAFLKILYAAIHIDYNKAPILFS